MNDYQERLANKWKITLNKAWTDAIQQNSTVAENTDSYFQEYPFYLLEYPIHDAPIFYLKYLYQNKKFSYEEEKKALDDLNTKIKSLRNEFDRTYPHQKLSVLINNKITLTNVKLVGADFSPGVDNLNKVDVTFTHSHIHTFTISDLT